MLGALSTVLGRGKCLHLIYLSFRDVPEIPAACQNRENSDEANEEEEEEEEEVMRRILLGLWVEGLIVSVEDNSHVALC